MKQFQVLPGYVQRLFETQVLFGVLKDVGDDFNNPSSPFAGQYARGFQAISTLFPASLGYTANDLSGGSNGANTLVQTGNLDIRSTTIQTQQGATSRFSVRAAMRWWAARSPPPEIVSGTRVISGPGTQGILTLEKGDVDIFTDQSLLLAQSRVFTEQGGNMTIWSSNGDINAARARNRRSMCRRPSSCATSITFAPSMRAAKCPARASRRCRRFPRAPGRRRSACAARHRRCGRRGHSRVGQPEHRGAACRERGQHSGAGDGGPAFRLGRL